MNIKPLAIALLMALMLGGCASQGSSDMYTPMGNDGYTDAVDPWWP
ncbi:hypothetical protein [Halomonas sp. M4R1S46]|nr:hypothetical protein [Halomonas sp. M4R1S46]UYG09432.1 hypothetical protein OCT48_08910 [Halomonas sp. M4R1S46]